MKDVKLNLGFVPTRRDVFSVEEAIKHKEKIMEYVSGIPSINLIDIEDINEEGLLYDFKDLDKTIRKMKLYEIDALFFPHCNFGTEALVAEVARKFDVPVLIWGPRDDSPLENGFRTRDSQCGMFATTKVLQRYKVKYTYLTNTDLNSTYFQEGFSKFLKVSNVVKVFNKTRILQISTRPQGFNSVVVNEGELLSKFDVRLFPVALTEVTELMPKYIENQTEEFKAEVDFVATNISLNTDRVKIEKMIALKHSIREIADIYSCNAAAIQCWNALQKEIGIMPCLANSLLGDEGFPCVCETDVNGAISSLLLQAATLDTKPVFFADLTVRDRDRENVELLWHCGPFPYSLAKDKSKATAGSHWILESGAYGTCEWEIHGGDITLCRFDGVHGEYQMLIGEGKGVDGPYNRGTYVWFEVEDWPKWERKIIEGPYIHHISGVHGKYGEVLLEALKYINNVKPDVVEPSIEVLKNRWI